MRRAKIILLDRRGNFFLGLHRKKPRFWTIFGGFINRNEEIREGLFRELYEETDGMIETLNNLGYVGKIKNKFKTYFYTGIISDDDNPSEDFTLLNNSEIMAIQRFSQEEMQKLIQGENVNGIGLWKSDLELINSFL
jgi:ADP-ribose pyrophosphatase YjhB (NUDIX family)